MNPLSQLFALMLEQIPEFVPPKTWSDDPEKRIAQREILAGQLLFKEGLAACRRQATRAFFGMMGASPSAIKTMSESSLGFGMMGASSSSVGGSSSSNATSGGAAATASTVKKPRISSAVKPAAGVKQATLQSFFRDSALVEDARLVKEMRAIKTARKKASKGEDS